LLPLNVIHTFNKYELGNNAVFVGPFFDELLDFRVPDDDDGKHDIFITFLSTLVEQVLHRLDILTAIVWVFVVFVIFDFNPSDVIILTLKSHSKTTCSSPELAVNLVGLIKLSIVVYNRVLIGLNSQWLSSLNLSRVEIKYGSCVSSVNHNFRFCEADTVNLNGLLIYFDTPRSESRIILEFG